MGCCDEIIEMSSPGQNGTDGITYYPHVAYADNVVSGTPDVVTGFSTTPQTTSFYWAVIYTTSSVHPGVASAFEDKWALFRGADGSGSAGINVKVNNSTVTGGPFTTLDFLGAGLSGITGTNAGSGEVDITIVTAGLITLSRAQALTLVATRALVSGATYLIYDVGDGAGLSSTVTAGIVLRAINAEQFSLDGIYIARIPKRATINQWNHVTSYAIGDHVEDLNEVYTANTITTPGELPSLLTEWDFETKDQDAYYTTEIQACLYDITYDAIIKRWDKRGNVLEVYNIPNGQNCNEIFTQCFRWGTEDVQGNKIKIDASNTISGWSTGRLPNDNSFMPTYIDGYFKNNIVELVSGTISFWPRIHSYFELCSCNITNNTFLNSNITYDNGCIISDSTFIDNQSTALDITCNILKSIFKNTCIFTGNDTTTYVSNCIFDNCTITDNTSSTSLSTLILKYTTINANSNTTISNVSGTMLFIENNANIVIEYTTGYNGYIRDNVNNVGANKASCKLTELSLLNEAKIDGTRWNTTGIIARGELVGNYGVIVDLLIDTTVSATTTNVLAAARTLKQPGPNGYILDMFRLENVGLNGDSLTLGTRNDTVAFGPYAPENISCSPSNSSFHAYVDAATAIAGGVLTIPIWAEHAGVIFLYNAPATNIDTIQLASGTYSSRYKGTRRFYKYSDAGTLTFGVTAIAGPPIANQIIGSGSVTLNRPYDFVELRKSGSFYTLENSKIVT